LIFEWHREWQAHASLLAGVSTARELLLMTTTDVIATIEAVSVSGGHAADSERVLALLAKLERDVTTCGDLAVEAGLEPTLWRQRFAQER
jgi:hypothetical protein